MKATIVLFFHIMAALALTKTTLASTPGGLRSTFVDGFTNPTIHSSQGGLGICVSGIVPVMATTSNNLKFNFSLPTDQSRVTEAFVEFSISSSNFVQSITSGTQTISGTYDIGATLCIPTGDTLPSSVQFLTHGLGFDRTYWDFTPDYSYVDAAIESGHAAFFYDRLGVGLSCKPDPLNVVQAPLELEIANNLITMLRRGDLGHVEFPTVVGVGHSFGSVITEAVTAAFPESLDAAILTGYSINATGEANFFSGLNPAIASNSQPYRFSGLGTGYLVSGSKISTQFGFFRAPGFDPTILSLADATKGSITFGELFSPGTIVAPAINFTGPVAVINGAEDLPFCFGNCSYPTNLPAEVQKLYPHVSIKRFATYLAPTTGHGLNFHYSAPKAYGFIQNFLKSEGF